MFRALSSVVVGLVVGCTHVPAPERPSTGHAEEGAGASNAGQTPVGQLPRSVVPLAYTLEFTILPERATFSGRTQIVAEVKEQTRRIWLHGLNLTIKSATVAVGGQTIVGEFSQVNAQGLAALDLPVELPIGRAVLAFDYEAEFDRKLNGLYRVDEGGNHYAFTQFEPYAARAAFPSFDEPVFKTPFDVWITVRKGQVAVTNGPEQERQPIDDKFERIRFKRTQPLPTYLIALAVGPLDVVEAPDLPPTEIRPRPIPLRGIAARGKGKHLAYALQRTPTLLEALERYFGIPYPYDKLDVIAVPDFAAGAMENAGAITFREWLLLVDEEQATRGQERSFAYVMAHELAHQWFGNLVTMPWWDDIWLNEAFATWMGHRVVQQVWPEHNAGLDLLGSVHHAMQEDSLVSARMIRQPIKTTHDISSAFDSITYDKGGGVLAMFERYVGAERFREGIGKYLRARPFGSATATDLLQTLSDVSGKDLTTPFNTFLEQAGVPIIRAQMHCTNTAAKLTLSQERFLPIGSRGSRSRRWQVPVCVHYGNKSGGDGSLCTLLTEPTGELPFPSGCPTWVMPNADAAGYYLWSLPPRELATLVTEGFEALSTQERMSLARAVRAGLEAGTMGVADTLPALSRLARGKARPVVAAPMPLLSFVHEYILVGGEKATLEAYARKLYTPWHQRLGFKALDDDSGETKLLRSRVLGFLANTGRDPLVRKRLAELGGAYLGNDEELHPDAVDEDLTQLAVRVALEEGDEALFDRAYRHFVASDDASIRYVLLSGLSSVRDGRSERALALVLDENLRVNEVTIPLRSQVGDHRTRSAAWNWFVAHFDAIAQRLSSRGMAHLTHLADPFCSKAYGKRVRDLFSGRIEAMDGGPRHLDQTLETLALCDARVKFLQTEKESLLDRLRSAE